MSVSTSYHANHRAERRLMKTLGNLLVSLCTTTTDPILRDAAIVRLEVLAWQLGYDPTFATRQLRAEVA